MVGPPTSGTVLPRKASLKKTFASGIERVPRSEYEPEVEAIETGECEEIVTV
jgi:hypothetical protein